MSQVMLEKYSNGDDGAQKVSILKWKWFIQDHTTQGMQGGDILKQGASFPLGLTLELCEELLVSVVTWTVSYK